MKRSILAALVFSILLPWAAIAEPLSSTDPQPSLAALSGETTTAGAVCKPSSLEAILVPKPLPASCEFTCVTGGTCPKFEGLPKPRCVSGCCVY